MQEVDWKPNAPVTFWLTRHGVSEYNLEDRIGGDSSITSDGQIYADTLPSLFGRVLQESCEDHRFISVWTSTLLRTIQTASKLPLPQVWRHAHASMCRTMNQLIYLTRMLFLLLLLSHCPHGQRWKMQIWSPVLFCVLRACSNANQVGCVRCHPVRPEAEGGITDTSLVFITWQTIDGRCMMHFVPQCNPPMFRYISRSLMRSTQAFVMVLHMSTSKGTCRTSITTGRRTSYGIDTRLESPTLTCASVCGQLCAS